MVYRIFVEKKEAFALEANVLMENIRSFMGIDGLTQLRLFNRYDAQNISPEHFERSKNTVFSEPQTDDIFSQLPVETNQAFILAVEYLPGQFDQRADSAAQCIQLLFQCERPLIKSTKVYCMYGKLSEEEKAAIRRYLINPVDSREAALDVFDTLAVEYPPAQDVPVLEGFIFADEAQLHSYISDYALAMDIDDILFCQEYFNAQKRNPTLTELRVIDTYWSDHCRHTTFLTELTDITFEHPQAQQMYEQYLNIKKELGVTKPTTLMNLATIAAKHLQRTGQLQNLDESEEINACTVRLNVDVNGQTEPWLLLFKNETHNHPTEIEPFGGAATCIGGAIRDPLSGRAYVYQAMRVTGAADPLAPMESTPPGKLPQRKIVTEAAAGYSAYGNQIGLATGLVDELYHPGYAAKRMEIGAVIGAAPQANVFRQTPSPGDVVLLLGGRTGRDGCGGATGSSKTHGQSSLSECAAEVQKGNAPEERKLQRLFRNPKAAQLIKRCNDFGAGGVSVAIGELADGLNIDLDSIPLKYAGLSGTELAISESQERMAVVLDKNDVQLMLELASEENIEATPVAVVTQAPCLTMSFKGKQIVNLTREFLNSNGARKFAKAHVAAPLAACYPFQLQQSELSDRLYALISDLNVCSKRGLVERFDSTIGAGTLLMPFGGKLQRTPTQAMAAKLPVLNGQTSTCTFMAYGYNPHISKADPFKGAYLAVVESVARLIASGSSLGQCYLTFQEYFPHLRSDPKRWGQPVAALLGALKAQLELGLAAIGGKDSMSGSFEDLDVPPTLVSFAVSAGKVSEVQSPEFKRHGSRIALLSPEMYAQGLPLASSLLSIWKQAFEAFKNGRVLSAWTPSYGGIMEGIFKMTLGNRIGCQINMPSDTLFQYCYGGLILETLPEETIGQTLGRTLPKFELLLDNQAFSLVELEDAFNSKLEPVYPTQPSTIYENGAKTYTYQSRFTKLPIKKVTQPRVLIPVFPGTNCEYDSAAAWEKAGAKPQTFIVRNLSRQMIMDSALQFAQALRQSEILFLPGGFSGADEPDGSAKLITAFLRNEHIANEIDALLNKRDGLIGGICNGFQALIKLGLLPYGEIRELTASDPTLTFNTIGRHQSKLVQTRVVSVLSPWFSLVNTNETYLVPISHGEGRFVCENSTLECLVQNGQIATQYVDDLGKPTLAIEHNPNGSVHAIEGITSPDGRIFGKMGHSERVGEGLYKNVPGNTKMPLFEGAVKYFQ